MSGPVIRGQDDKLGVGDLSGGIQGVSNIIIPTMVQSAADALSYVDSMTCLFDPRWVAQQNKVTLPIAFFHINSIREIHKTNVSTKRVLLYEPQVDMTSSAAANQVRPSVMRAITDNAYRDPKTFVINAILPYQPVGRYIKEAINTVSATVLGFMSMLGVNTDNPILGEDLNRVWTGAFSSVSTALKLMSQTADAVGKMPNMNGVSYINKNSIDAMAEGAQILCMKMWTGYDYEFVIIENMEIEKKPLEDDVFRVTLQVKVVNVLTVTRPSDPKPTAISRNWASRAISTTEAALSIPLRELTGVDTAVSGSNVVDNTLGSIGGTI